MDKLRIHVCGHNNLLDGLPSRPFIKKVMLQELDIGKYQDNQLAESRMFLADIEPAEYVGFLSQRYREKWPGLVPFQALDTLPFSPDTILCAEIPFPTWDNWFKVHSPGIAPLFDDMVAFSGMKERWPTFINNNFICSWDIYQEFLGHWRRIFYYLYDKYPPATMTYETYDNKRRAGVLYEALSTLIFGHLIHAHGLKVAKMAKPNTVFKKRILLCKN